MDKTNSSISKISANLSEFFVFNHLWVSQLRTLPLSLLYKHNTPWLFVLTFNQNVWNINQLLKEFQETSLNRQLKW
jgi:hypothetical protein